MAAAATTRLWFVRHGEAEHNPFIVLGKQNGDEVALRRGRSILDPGYGLAWVLAAQLMLHRLAASDLLLITSAIVPSRHATGSLERGDPKLSSSVLSLSRVGHDLICW